MSSNPRQPKPARNKGGPDPSRRSQAWTGARASPTYSPSNTPRPQNVHSPSNSGNYSSLAQQNGVRPDNSRDRVLQALSGLTGTTITLLTKSGQRYEGAIASTNAEGDTNGVTLKDVKEISNPGAPLKDSLFIASTNIDTWTSGPADAKPTNGDTFKTDVDISAGKKAFGRERELQAWVPSGDAPLPADDDTFGPGASSVPWDQFTANEQLFGIKPGFDEDVYTTKIDRNAPDFKDKERKAQRIANEIMGTATNNPHVAEERGLLDDSGANEEDKYGAVVRGTNAYVPPGARKAGLNGAPPAAPTGAAAAKPAEVPKVSVNGPDGNAVPANNQSPVPSKTSSPAPTPAAANNGNKPPADPLPAFRDFVVNERQRLTQKRQALVKSEMDKRMAELVKFSQNFKLNKPIPEDLVPILAKDEDKQKAIREKASRDAASTQARVIGASTPATASRGVLPPGKHGDAARKPIAQLPASKTVAGAASNLASLAQAPPASASVQKIANTTAPSSSSNTPGASTKATEPGAPSAGTKKINMFIQPIPPFKGNKKQPATPPVPTAPAAKAPGPGANGHGPTASNASAAPASPIAANRLNVNAPSFRSKGSVSPSLSAASASVSPKPKAESAPSTPNPFFGTRPLKKSTPVSIKDDFNPFKHNKVVDASQVSAMWPYNGKRYMLMYPPPQHPPQHAPHMAPAVATPMPPPTYEEDSAAQAAAAARGGYVYAYPHYGYPGQPMMPGMPPPGPPGAYMQGPFMQPMPYGPGMPPPNAMYSPAMGQMPPPQPYMQPPPGAYPPPNGAGQRPSMPPTPIPSHAHPYYHQSPQMQHAVPYPMMMPPPTGVPPHPYDGSAPPQVPMGGHA